MGRALTTRSPTAALDECRALLASTLPGESRTLLLRACLWGGERGEAAWRRWLEGRRDPARALDGSRALMPLLAVSLREERGGATAELRTLLKAAYVREKARYETYRQITASALATLATAGVSPIVLKGAALAETVYAEPWLRHCHDVDLLLPRARMSEAAASLAASGFRRLRRLDRGGDHLGFEHASGLPLFLHGEPFLPRVYASAEAFAAAAVRQEVCEVSARVLSAPAALVHACGHASYQRGGERLRWVCDAWSILARTEALDWGGVLGLATTAGLTIPLSVQLDYLAEALAAPIPREVRGRLLRAPASAAEVRAAAFGAFAGSWSDLRRGVEGAGSYPGRLAALAMVFPHVLLRPWGAAAGFPLPTIFGTVATLTHPRKARAR